ncbi:hypothetical protein [Parerythrobacter aestuarii]|uniref:hypothetical protein n=1 Tax=Parerythrobacter aestuarii TaxID=3020909 RepID=UPI0024DE0494|nr:hypothetical protein [Parerythrobacter aestuarii]
MLHANEANRSPERCIAAMSPELTGIAERFADLVDMPLANEAKDSSYSNVWAMLVLAKDWSPRVARILRGGNDRISAPGLILAIDEADAERQVDRWIEAASQPVKPAMTSLEFRISEPGDIRPAGPGQLIAGNATSGPVLRALFSAGADVVRIATHGDGLDASLGQAGPLCALAGRRPEVLSNLEGPLPACLAQARCYRMDCDVEEALDSGHLVSPSEVNARVVILDTCSGSHFSTASFDGSLSLAMSLLAGPNPPVVITRSGISFGYAEADRQLMEDLRKGATIGEAVARYNVSKEPQRIGRDYLIIGNPAVRVASPSGVVSTHNAEMTVRLRDPALPVRSGRGKKVPVNSRSSWLANIAARACESSELKRLDTATRAKLKALANTLQRSGLHGNGKSVSPVAIERSQASLIRLVPLLGRDALTDLWEAQAGMHLHRFGKCAACGALEMTFHARISKAEDRTLVICEACGLIADRPASWPKSQVLAVTGNGTVVIPKLLRAPDTVMSLYAYDMRPAKLLENRPFAKTVRLPLPAASGPFQIGYWLYRDGAIAVHYSRVYLDKETEAGGRWVVPKCSPTQV